MKEISVDTMFGYTKEMLEATSVAVGGRRRGGVN